MRRFVFLGAFSIACVRFSARFGDELAVEGVAADWRSGAPIASAQIRTVGIVPEVTAIADAEGRFTLLGVPANGYVLLEVQAGGYRRTLSPPVLVEETDVLDATAFGVASADASALLSGFGVVSSSGRGAIAGRVLRTDGTGMPGVSSISLSLAFDGPHFLDETLGLPALEIAATSSSGGFVLANVPPGSATAIAAGGGLAFDEVAVFVDGEAWTVVELRDESGLENPIGTPPPTPAPTPTLPPQTFEGDIEPIFQARGCAAQGCHRGAGAAGNMQLTGTSNSIYGNVLPRCNLADPSASLILVKPLFEQTPNHGGGNIFLSTADMDYRRLHRWISDGAPNN